MDPETPWWLVITASAVGGAFVTTGWNAIDRLLSHRHRHDETRRDHYVALMAAFDDLHQALVVAYDKYDTALAAVKGSGLHEGRQFLAAHASDEARGKARKRLVDARRAFLRVSLFAPKKLAVSAGTLLTDMATQYHRVNPLVDGTSLRVQIAAMESLGEPPYPVALWVGLRDAIRRDLGVRRLKVEL